jgi:hypothetical protein
MVNAVERIHLLHPLVSDRTHYKKADHVAGPTPAPHRHPAGTPSTSGGGGSGQRGGVGGAETLLEPRLRLAVVAVVNVVVAVGARRDVASDMGNRLCLLWMRMMATMTATPLLLSPLHLIQ